MLVNVGFLRLMSSCDIVGFTSFISRSLTQGRLSCFIYDPFIFLWQRLRIWLHAQNVISIKLNKVFSQWM